MDSFGVFHHRYAASLCCPYSPYQQPCATQPGTAHLPLHYLCLTRRGLLAARTTRAGQDGPAGFQSKRCGKIKLYF